MNVLILGSGGREHAIAWKISQSSSLNRLFVAPGNAGTAEIAENVNLDNSDFDAVKAFVLKNEIHLIVIGPEQPLVDGITDYFRSNEELAHVQVLGPDSSAAMLEGSKDFAKDFMKRHGIPTAAYQSFGKTDVEQGRQFLDTLQPPYVLKADGLAAGKGVLILDDIDEAKQQLQEMLLNAKFGKASDKVVIEEFLDGIECSVFAITDGKDYLMLPVAKDYKRIGEGDTGLNTGGMGCVSPVDFADDSFMQKVEQRIVKPTINGLNKEDFDYRGFLFFGLMNVGGDPYVIEYNVRMGDPETQVVLPRVQGDFLQVCYGAASAELAKHDISISKKHMLAVIAASGGYPESYEKGKQISGLQNISDALVFHAGTKVSENKTLSNGGRVLAVVAEAENLGGAREKAYQEISKLHFDKIYFRKDIGNDLLG
jgi:phosphoribosylamine--glycine ligase